MTNGEFSALLAHRADFNALLFASLSANEKAPKR